MLKNLVKISLVTIGVSLLASCTQKFNDVNATAKEMLFGGSEVELTVEQIHSVPYASMYVKINDGGKVFMVLAHVEENPITDQPMLKWMSADKGVIVTEQGRIIKTMALYDMNLSALNNNNAPKYQYNNSEKQQWSSIYDWQPNYRFGYEATNIRQYLDHEIIESVLWTKNTQKVEELVKFDVLDRQITNTFWIDEQSHVVKSIQYIGPDMTKIEMLQLKHYVN